MTHRFFTRIRWDRGRATNGALAWYRAGFTGTSGAQAAVSVINNTPTSVSATASHKLMLNGDATEYATNASQVDGKEFLISVLDTENDYFVNKLQYGANLGDDDRLSGTSGIVAVVIEASTSGVDGHNVATYSLQIKVTYTGSGTVKYYTDLDESASSFATKDGSTYYTVATSSVGSNLSAKAWVFVDGTTEDAWTAAHALTVNYQVIQNA